MGSCEGEVVDWVEEGGVGGSCRVEDVGHFCFVGFEIFEGEVRA